MMDNERLSAIAFSKQSAIFDDIYSGNTIVRYKRERVRAHVEQYLPPQSRILELNAGTGEDAVYFAGRGHKVHATDISEGMQSQLVDKTTREGLDHLISNELCSFTNLKELKNKGPYGLIFSNFAGLNCTNQLQDVLESFKPLLSDKGLVTLVVLPPFCLWEMLMVFRGKLKTAIRRFTDGKQGTQAHIEGTLFRCWYYRPSYITNVLKKDFDLLRVEGLCTIVPPSYIEGFAEKYPKLFSTLKALENRYKQAWPWKYIGDYYIITLRKK